MKKISNYLQDNFYALKKVPSIILTIFTLVVVVMNILAGKTIYQNEYIAIDGGIIVTWIVIVIMDIVTITYGPKTTIRMSIFAQIVNLTTNLILYLASIIPSSGNFSSFNQVIGGTWFIVISGSIAFLVSSTLNTLINYGIGKLFKKNPEGKLAFACRSCGSTFISTFIDNFLFNILAFMVFAPLFANFNWTIIQCVCCALLYCGIELIIETFLFPVSLRIYRYLKSKRADE